MTTSNSSPICNLFAELLDEMTLRGLGRPVAAGVQIDSISYVGKLVRRHRVRTGMTQHQLATAAGVGRRFVSELEAGKPTIRAAELLAVCSAAGLTLSLRPADTQV